MRAVCGLCEPTSARAASGGESVDPVKLLLASGLTSKIGGSGIDGPSVQTLKKVTLDPAEKATTSSIATALMTFCNPSVLTA